MCITDYHVPDLCLPDSNLGPRRNKLDTLEPVRRIEIRRVKGVDFLFLLYQR